MQRCHCLLIGNHSFAQSLETLKNSIVSEYHGNYFCAQGMTSLTIQFLKSEPNSQAVAIFKFGPSHDDQSIPFGAFLLTGTADLSGGKLELQPLSWLTQPPGYTMVGLSGTSSDGGNTFEGTIRGFKCTDFSISRVTAPSAESLPTSAPTRTNRARQQTAPALSGGNSTKAERQATSQPKSGTDDFLLPAPHAALAQGLFEASDLNERAIKLGNAGRYSDAEPLYKQSLAIREKVLGPNHSEVAASLNNLASLYESEGRYLDAEPLLQRSLAIYEKELGPNHPEVAVSLNNLAVLYSTQGRYSDAEPLYKRALAIDEKGLGPDHPMVALYLSNLAALYNDQGRYADAEPLLQRSLAISEKALGPDHPDVAGSLNNLATLYGKQGRYSDAEPLYKRALAINEKGLGPDHPAVALSLSNLAVLYNDQGRYADAEPLYKRSLAIREKALGPDHPDVAQSLINLGDFSTATRDATRMRNRCTNARWQYPRKRSVPIILNVAESLNSLAVLYETQGRLRGSRAIIKAVIGNKRKGIWFQSPQCWAVAQQSGGSLQRSGTLCGCGAAIEARVNSSRSGAWSWSS